MHPMNEATASQCETLVAALWRTTDRRGTPVTMPRRLGCILALGLHGLRATEICNLKLKDLALPQATLYVHAIKRGRDRVVQLDREFAWSLRTCNEMSKVPTDVLLPTGTGHRIVQSTLSGYAAHWLQHNIGPFTCHSLRHTAAMRCYRATHDPLAVMHLLGHKTFRHTLVYLAAWHPVIDGGPTWPPRYVRTPIHVLGGTGRVLPPTTADLRDTAKLTPRLTNHDRLCRLESNKHLKRGTHQP